MMKVSISSSDLVMLLDKVPTIIEMGKDKNEFFEILRNNLMSVVSLHDAFSKNNVEVMIELDYHVAMDVSSLSLYINQLGL